MLESVRSAGRYTPRMKAGDASGKAEGVKWADGPGQTRVLVNYASGQQPASWALRHTTPSFEWQLSRFPHAASRPAASGPNPSSVPISRQLRI